MIISEMSAGSSSSGDLFGDVIPSDLTLIKSGSPDPVIAGAILTYTLTYTNTGISFAQEVFITDTLPDNVIFGSMVSASPPITMIKASSPTWYSSTVGSDVSGTIVFTVTVKPGTTSPITNTANITSTTPDLTLADNIMTIYTGVTAEADLVIV